MDTNRCFSIATFSRSSSEIRQENKTFLREEQERFKRLYKHKIQNGQFAKLGEGGNGEVFQGVDIKSNEDVAIKRVTSYNSLSTKLLSNCSDKEFNFLEKLKNVSGVIKLYDFFQLESVNLYVMEKPVCKDLHSHIYDVTRVKRPSDNDNRKLFKQAVKIAISCMENEVFHCDIKPANYLVDVNNKLYLIDFGNSLKSKREGYNSKFQKGTPQYMPPEAHSSTIYHEEPTTVWSLGCLLYEIMCSKLLFTGNLAEICFPEVHVPSRISNLTLEAQDLILQCLRLDPNDRITLKKILTHPWTLGIALKTQSQKRKFATIAQEQIDFESDESGPDPKKQEVGSESGYDTVSVFCSLTSTGHAKDPQSRPVVPGGSGGAKAVPVLGRPVNHISTRGVDYASQITTGISGFSDFPTDLPPSHQQELIHDHTPTNIQALQAFLDQQAYQQTYQQAYQQAVFTQQLYLQALQAPGFHQATVAEAPARPENRPKSEEKSAQLVRTRCGKTTLIHGL